MKLQRGRFLVKYIDELNTSRDKRIVKLDEIEHDSPIIIASRMKIELEKEQYGFYPTNIMDKNGKSMILYLNPNNFSEDLEKTLEYLGISYINENYSLWSYITHPNEQPDCDFWWNIQENIMVFFGEDKIPIIKHFINSNYYNDGEQEAIQEKLTKLVKPYENTWLLTMKEKTIELTTQLVKKRS